MGLLNNWLNKKKKDQLKTTGEKPKTSASVKKEEAKKPVKAKEIKQEVSPFEASPFKEKDKEQSEVKKSKTAKNDASYKVLVKPLVTEKSAIAESGNKYSFVVAMWANKFQVKKAVEDIYGVKPENVNIMNVDGRRVRFGRTLGRRSDYKKAVVTLPQGKSIDIHTGV